MNIREYLKENKIMTDGAFGTYYAQKYGGKSTSIIAPERANLEAPEKVIAIHREYLDAGAKLIRTNTFACNTVLMETDWTTVKKNIRAGAANAKEAACGREVFIAGDIGPIPAKGFAEAKKIEEEYYRIACALVDTGLDILVFETFPELDHLLPAIRRIAERQKKAQKDLFIIVDFAIDQFGYSNAGISGKQLLQEAAKQEEIDAMGFNCGVGPAHMYQFLKEQTLPADKFLVTMPNAGYPKISRKELAFGNTPSYFTQKMKDLDELGSDILGGCCGTTPYFMKKLQKSLEWKQHPRLLKAGVEKCPEKRIEKKGFLYQENGTRKEKKLIAVELAPPFNADDEKIMESAHLLAREGVDVLTFPDSPSGRTRIDSVLMAAKVHKETGITVMPHICCRDRNAVAIRSMLLGAYINDIYNFLLITGDPLPSMARKSVKAVFDFDSTGLMNIAREMNQETFGNVPVCFGGAINQGRRNLDVEIGRVKKKMECGAEFFLTQPVFSREDAERLRRVKEETGAVILCGIMPLVSRKNALFMKNEISGVNVPAELVSRYPEKGSREEGEAVGIAMAKEMIGLTEDFVDGYYFSFPFNRIHMLKEILGSLEE